MSFQRVFFSSFLYLFIIINQFLWSLLVARRSLSARNRSHAFGLETALILFKLVVDLQNHLD